jgi:hypothetical protein
VARLVRQARHATLDAIRTDLGVEHSMKPADDFNAFRGTDLEAAYGKRKIRG